MNNYYISLINVVVVMNEVMVLTKVIGCTLATSNRRALVVVKVIIKEVRRPVLGLRKKQNYYGSSVVIRLAYEPPG